MVSRTYWTPYFLFIRCLALLITDDRYCKWAFVEKKKDTCVIFFQADI